MSSLAGGDQWFSLYGTYIDTFVLQKFSDNQQMPVFASSNQGCIAIGGRIDLVNVSLVMIPLQKLSYDQQMSMLASGLQGPIVSGTGVEASILQELSNNPEIAARTGGDQ